ncbi:hypothetical protein WJX72_010737 [[Myrmecia] bisecta]|uniref:Purine permease n=1 Tax=[Myrmecia] bisecta TaxID=41462 RepID=A0AAW1Q844_9CHLO
MDEIPEGYDNEPVITYKDFDKLLNYKDPQDCLIGKYDYKSLCMPRFPFCRNWRKAKARPPQKFFAVDEPLPFILCLLMGFQHAVAMVGGIIVPPIVIASTQSDPAIKSYLVSASLIVCGIGSIVQCMRWRIPRTRLYYGTGLITVVGTGVQQLQVIVSSIKQQLADGKDWNTAYGNILGTLLLCALTPIAISFFPRKLMNRIFPPWVTGVTVFVAGASLCGVGVANWGGGLGCTVFQTPDNPAPLCTGNGDVLLPFGNAAYLGLGFTVMAVIIVIELFGSIFMRNVAIMAGFLVGYAIAAVATYDGKHFTNDEAIKSSPNFQFMWLKTFPIGIYPAAIIPLIIGYAVDAANSIGDITASEEASALPTFGRDHDAHLQGGLLADGVSSAFSALATVTPVLVFAQNNGVISFTMVASRIAGVFCGIWLILFGIFGKFGGFLANAPNVILGGMQVFIFSSVAIAGIRLMGMTNYNRRVRFIQVMSVGLGLGVTIVANWGTNDLWNITPGMSSGVKSIRNSVVLVTGTGFAMAFIICVVLHNLLPEEEDPTALQEASARNAAAYGSHAGHGEGPAPVMSFHNPKMVDGDDTAHGGLPVKKVDLAPPSTVTM